MGKRNFLLLSLEDKKAKQVANVVSNASCKKILDYLAENEGTESEISKALKIPLSTVHYNLKQLMDSGLVDADEYHYSEKGKEVYHYKLANKYIVIAPKSEKSSLREKLKGILPIGLIGLGAAFIIQFADSFFSKESVMTQSLAAPGASNAAQKRVAAPEAIVAEADAAESAVAADMDDGVAADSAMEAVEEEVVDESVAFAAESFSEPSIDLISEPVSQTASVFPESIALWFFVGVVFSLVLVLLFRMKGKDRG